MSQLDPSEMSRTQQFIETYRITKQQQPTIGLRLLGTFVVGAVVGFVVFWLLPPSSGLFSWLSAVVGLILVGLVATLFVFSRAAQKAAYSRIEGQPGAAAAALNMLRRGWNSTPAVGFNKNQDIVHRVVGPPGVVLVGEGTSANRVRALLASERAKHQRVLADTPIHQIVVGDGEDQIPLPKLNKTIMKLKREVAPGEITDILNRLKALDSTRGTIPMPKGPMPTSMRGMRQNLRGR